MKPKLITDCVCKLIGYSDPWYNRIANSPSRAFREWSSYFHGDPNSNPYYRLDVDETSGHTTYAKYYMAADENCQDLKQMYCSSPPSPSPYSSYLVDFCQHFCILLHALCCIKYSKIT